MLAAIIVVVYHVITHIVQGTPSSSPSSRSPSSSSFTTTTTIATTTTTTVPPSIKLANVKELPVFIGLVFFAFAIQGVILGVESVTAKPKNFLKLLDISAIVGAVLYSSFGCMCYYSYGSDTSQIIFQSIASDSNSIDLRSVEVLFCCSMILLYPMQLVRFLNFLF